jgi:hypothetical protein
MDEFDAFIDEGIRQSESRGYHPREFIRMRQQYGTVPAIERLVRAGEIQSGFLRLQKLNMLEWSIEAAVQKFPERFTQEAHECADFRLKNINNKALRR